MRRHLLAKGVGRPRPTRRSRSCSSRATSTTRASRSASRRTGGGWTRGEPTGSSSAPAGARRPREHIAPALAGGAEEELDAAVALLRRRFGAPPETDRDRERALGLLVRKGYDLELAYDAVRALGRAA